MFFHVRWAFVEVASINMDLFAIPFASKGYLWVDCFFLLSGFVLAHRYGREKIWSGNFLKSFFVGRWARIYPLHFVTFVSFLTYVGVTKGLDVFNGHGLSITANFLLIHNWGFVFMEHWNYPSWSLSAEWAAYLLFPILMTVVAFASRRLALATSALVALLFTFGLYVYGVHKGSMDFMHGNGWIRCLFGFTAGLLLYRISQLTEGVASRRWFDFGALAFLMAQFLMLQFMKEEFVFVLLSVGLIFCLSHAEGPITRVLNSRPLLYLGEISFSIYMWHALLGKMFQDSYRAAGLPALSVPVSVGLLIALIGVILVVSALSYHAIELRLSVALRKRLSALVSR